MSEFNSLTDLLKNDLSGKKVLLRADLNVPVKGGKISDHTRIIGLIPTISKLIDKKAKVILISHFGRPEGKYDSSYSLSFIVDDMAAELKNHLGREVEVKFGVDCIGNSAKEAVASLKTGSVLILENLRFHKEEESNGAAFAKQLAELGDYYINDAFSCSHRSHASITGLASLLPAYAGLLLEKEVTCLKTALNSPEKPMAAIVGGSKISTKMDLLYSLIEKADYLFIGGGMANTFLYAKGVDIGSSLCEKDLKVKALEILKKAESKGCKVMLPIDAAVAKSINEGKNCQIKKIGNIPSDQMILDIGTQTLVEWNTIISKCKTLIWNGPVGAFEFAPFENSSVALARSVAYFTANNKLNSVAGGGDTVALLSTAGLKDSLSYMSTAGGAFLEWLEGKNLPGIQALIDCAGDKKLKAANQ